MNINKRLSNIENNLNKSGKVICRLTGCDGDYPEQDIRKSRKVRQVSVKGVSCEELRRWAE